ncbi:T9SS type B sorting domain-containing protein [Ancylomarina salipaludis]|uniref:T9SS type B sorting domain-containing protein n=1 Tax=Ancylomarina salipaludis TaxID=2501299 RepID=A0A4Q1JPD3_9BACT|nr:gliding motility-associated C-terminal domain-containing protein [Ancylomarina salipaludis]RXQ96785.1 T9SS type B sorting domain-containing protein [Ancylomarina salipaludis]
MNYSFRSVKIETCFKIAILFLLYALPLTSKAQLDLIHYVPPLYAGTNSESDIEDHWVVLTTPSETPITVTIKKGDGTIFQVVEGVSMDTPKSIPLGSGTLINPPLGVVNYSSLNKVISDQGLIFTSSEAFYVNIRHKSEIHGLFLTAKGRAGLGTSFRSGHLYSIRGENVQGWGGGYYDRWGRWVNFNTKTVGHRSHFISVMATEDNTQVTFSDIKVGNLTSDTESALPITDDITVTLNAGQSYVIGADLLFLSKNEANGLNGTHITSDKPIAVNSGSWTGGASLNSWQDIGVDQIVPEDLVGSEYILLKGKGNDETERPIVVATQDNTNIYVNGGSTKINPTPLNAGDSYAIGANYYTTDGTMLIKCDKNVYLYQTTSASDRYESGIDYAYATVGMNFIPAISSLGFRQVDIPFVNQVGTGIVAIYSQKGANVFVNKSTTPLSQASAKPVSGNDEWVVYKYLTTDENVSVMSNKAIYVALSVEDDAVGAAGYFSGFTKAISPIHPETGVGLEHDLGYICESYNDKIELSINSTPEADFYEWYKNEIKPENLLFKNSNLLVDAPDVETKYIIKAYFRDPNLDIIYNGNFSIGRGSFDSSYDFTSVGNLENPGKSVLCYNPKDINAQFQSFNDKDGGGLMLLTHSTNFGTGDVIWSKTINENIKNQGFILKLYGRMAQEGHSQLLDIYVNDEKIYDNFPLNDVNTWQSVKAFWASGDSESARISVVNSNPAGQDGVFALDSISFVVAVEDQAEFNALVIPNYSYKNFNEPQHFCVGQAGELDISNGDVSWYDYKWEKKEGEIFVPITDPSITGLGTHKIQFAEVKESDAGIYRCTINFKENYQQCGESLGTASVEVELIADKSATVTINADKTRLCEGEQATLEAVVTGTYSGIKWFVDDVQKYVGKEFLFDNPAGEYKVRCEVGNACSTPSDSQDMFVYGRPVLNDLQIPTGLCENISAELTAVVNTVPAGASLSYKWYQGENLLATTSESTYSLEPTMDDSYYKVAVSAVYNVGLADEQTCVGNQIVKNIVPDAIYPKVDLKDLADVNLCEGDSYTYQAELGNTGDYYTYEWEVPFVSGADKTSSDFVIGSVTSAMAGAYKVTVSNRCDSQTTTSNLSVNPKLLVDEMSIDKTGPYCLNDVVTFSMKDNGEAKYYFAENLMTGEIINPITDPFSLTVTDLKQGRWKITAEAECGTRVEQEFDIYLLDDFSNPQMADITTCMDETVQLKVQIFDIPVGSDLTYEWTGPDGSAIVNDKSTLDIANVQLSDLGDYTCKVTNQCGYSQSVSANLSADQVNTSSTGSALEVCEGTLNYRLEIAYDGNPKFSWHFNNLSSPEIGTANYFEISEVKPENEGVYYCLVTLACGDFVTYQRQLVVNEMITVVEESPSVSHICEGEQTELKISASGDIKQIEWYDPSGNIIAAANNKTSIQTAVYNTAGSFIYKYKVVGDCDTKEGDFEVIVHDKPVLNPIADINSCEGDITLNMSISGSDYSGSAWWNADESLKLADGLSYIIADAKYLTESGNYIAKLSTLYCGDLRATAQVNIYQPITVVTHSNLNPTPCVGEPLSLIVNGSGSDLSYNWYKTDAPTVSLSKLSTLDLGTADLSDEGIYRCELISDNGCGNEIVEFNVDVREHAKITLDPVDVSICEGTGSANYVVNADAEGTLRYQWYDKDNNALAGETSANLEITNPLLNDGQSYYCEVSGEFCDPAVSLKAQLEVKKNVTITSNPVDVRIAEGGVATFTVEAEGNDPLTYQWYCNPTGIIAGATTSVLTIDPATIDLNSYKYYCVVSNACVGATSAEAVLLIDPNVKITAQPENTKVCEGETFEFVVEHKSLVAGKTCYWEYNDGSGFQAISGLADQTVIESANQSILRITNAKIDFNRYLFRAVVEGLTDDISKEVSVVVYQPVSFDTISNVEICKDAGVHFELTSLKGTGPYTYEWKENTRTWKTSDLNLDGAAALDGDYSIEVTNGVCPSHKEDFKISHYDELILNDIDGSSPVCQNVAENLVVTVSKDDALGVNYQWFKDEDATVLSSSNTYTVAGLGKSEEGLYKVEVSDGCMTKVKTKLINILDKIVAGTTWEANKKLCAGDEFLLDAQVSGDNPTYTWTVPNGRIVGNVSKLKIDNLTVADAGTYKCVVSSSCSDGDIVFVTELVVNEAPKITNGIDNLSAVCDGEDLELGPIVVDGEVVSTNWTLNDRSLSTVHSSILNLGKADVSKEGNYKVEVSNACGNDFSLGFQEVVLLPTLADIPNQTVCEGEDVVFRAQTTGENLDYKWFIDGVEDLTYSGKSELILENVKPLDENTLRVYDIECRVSSLNACGTEQIRHAQLVVNPNTILQSSIKSEVVYVDSDYEFNLDVKGSNLTYEWHHINKDGVDKLLTETSSILVLNNLTMADGGEYACYIGGTCGNRYTSGFLTVKDPLKIVEGLSKLVQIEKCFGEPLSLNIVVTGEVYDINWFKDDISLDQHNLSLFIPELDYSDAGKYRCEINGDGGKLIESLDLIVNKLTVLNSNLKDKNLCENEQLLWSAGVDGSNLTYNWQYNGATISTEAILNVENLKLEQAGEYRLDVTGKCGDVDTEAELKVYQLPYYSSHSEGVEVCENTDEVNFRVNYGGDNIRYQWRKDGIDIFGETSSLLTIQNITQAKGGVYTCAVNSSCGQEMISPDMVLSVIPNLKVLNQSGNLEICDGESAEFFVEAEGRNVQYQWQFNGNNIDGATNSIYQIDKSSLSDRGYYTCELSDECTSKRYSDSKQLEVNALPNSQIYGRMEVCVLEDRVTYTTSVQPQINYLWQVNGGEFTTPIDGEKTKITWGTLENGNISIRIVDEETGCYSQVDSLVQLHPLPDVSLSNLDSHGVCESEFQLTGGLPEGGIYWVNGVRERSFNPGTGKGEYPIRYSYTDENGCSNTTEEKIMTIDSLPVVKLIEDVTVGACKSKQLWAETQLDNIKWSPSRYLDDPTSKTPVFTSGESERYVAFVVDKHGCVGNDIVNVNVAPLPVITTINDTIIGQCKPLVLTTDIVGEVSEINWTSDKEQLSKSTIRDPQLENLSVGIHNFTINVSDMYGCIADASVMVDVRANPEIGESQFLCEGESIEINTRNLENAVWSDGYTAWERTIDKPGEYELSVSNEFGCTEVQKIKMNPLPKFKLDNTILPGILIFEGQTVTLDPDLNSDFGPYVYEWSDGSVLPQLVVSESDTYSLKVVDKIGCVATDTVVVEVKPVGIESPNAFTPGSGNENDRFYLKEINIDKDFEFYVYNRWGELMHRSTEAGYGGGWDGTYRGKKCPTGVYVWILIMDGKAMEKGYMTLVR